MRQERILKHRRKNFHQFISFMTFDLLKKVLTSRPVGLVGRLLLLNMNAVQIYDVKVTMVISSSTISVKTLEGSSRPSGLSGDPDLNSC